jgi:glycosyltransferase involved in cell wall biosynthesis
VCLEGMAAGRPILCLDLGGPGVQVTPETGIKVPAHTPEQAVKDLAYAMKRLALDADERTCMGLAGHQLVQSEYDWTMKGKDLVNLYQKVLMT